MGDMGKGGGREANGRNAQTGPCRYCARFTENVRVAYLLFSFLVLMTWQTTQASSVHPCTRRCLTSCVNTRSMSYFVRLPPRHARQHSGTSAQPVPIHSQADRTASLFRWAGEVGDKNVVVCDGWTRKHGVRHGERYLLSDTGIDLDSSTDGARTRPSYGTRTPKYIYVLNLLTSPSPHALNTQ